MNFLEVNSMRMNKEIEELLEVNSMRMSQEIHKLFGSKQYEDELEN